MHADADRQVGHDLRHLLLQSLAELEEVGAGLHPDGESDRGLALEPDQRRRRIGITACDSGNARQREKAVIDPQIDRLEAFLRGEADR